MYVRATHDWTLSHTHTIIQYLKFIYQDASISDTPESFDHTVGSKDKPADIPDESLDEVLSTVSSLFLFLFLYEFLKI